MPPAARGRKLECGQCGVSYRSTYRGRRPLCFSCQERAAEKNSLQTSSPPDTSFSKLPMDVLRSLVPYLLVGRIACVRMPESYSWALPAHAKRDRQIPCNAFLLHVFEKAWVPTIRIKLVCKALYRVVILSTSTWRTYCNHERSAFTRLQRSSMRTNSYHETLKRLQRSALQISTMSINEDTREWYLT